MNPSLRLLNGKHARHVIARAITCGLLMVLPSCRIPAVRSTDSGPALPGNYDGANNSGATAPGGATPESSAQLRVDEFYNDPALTRLICQAAATNRELRMLDEDVQIARYEIIRRRGAYLPFVGYRVTGGMDKPSAFTPLGAAEKQLQYFPGKNFPEPLPNVLASLNLFWQVDIWRELRNARDAAILRFNAAVDKRNYFVTRLVADIAENYYGLLALDSRLQVIDQTIAIQQKSYDFAKAEFDNARGTELPVQRFQAEISKNQSEKLIVRQEIVEVENRVNFLAGRYPQPVERSSGVFLDLNIHALSVGLPAQLLANRADVRQAERELEASGLDIKVARAHFFPRLDLSAGVGYQAFNPKYLFMTPEALIATAAADLTAPLLNKAAIRAEFLTANARQLQALYDYQRTVLNAFTEVINRMSQAANYGRSIEIKRQQLTALEKSVEVASGLYANARAGYIEILFATRDQLEARTVLIDTKRKQLSAIVNAYQALGGGYMLSCPPPDRLPDAGGAPRPADVPGGPRPAELPQLPAPREAKDGPAMKDGKDAPGAPRLPDLPLPPVPRKEKDAP